MAPSSFDPAHWNWRKIKWEIQHKLLHYTQYHLIRTTVNFLLVMVLIFSQNFTSNGPYVVLNFCEFSDTTVLIFWTSTFFGNSFSVTVRKSNIYKILLDMQHVMLHILVENTLWIAQKWSLVLTSWRFTSTGPYFFESVLPGPYKGGPYKMIMRVSQSSFHVLGNARKFVKR